MSVVAYDLRKIILLAAPCAAALLVATMGHATSQADVPAAPAAHMLVIPASDGYGFDDCLSSSKACGHVIADAWCEAHGLSVAISFGKSEDVTASLAEQKATAKVEPNAYIVNCRE